jgi:hypothetical protein
MFMNAVSVFRMVGWKRQLPGKKHMPVEARIQLESTLEGSGTGTARQ